MDKIDTKELVKSINSLCTVISNRNKMIEKQNQCIKDNTDALKELKTRLGSIANAISNGGTIVSK